MKDIEFNNKFKETVEYYYQFVKGQRPEVAIGLLGYSAIWPFFDKFGVKNIPKLFVIGGLGTGKTTILENFFSKLWGVDVVHSYDINTKARLAQILQNRLVVIDEFNTPRDIKKSEGKPIFENNQRELVKTPIILAMQECPKFMRDKGLVIKLDIESSFNRTEFGKILNIEEFAEEFRARVKSFMERGFFSELAKPCIPQMAREKGIELQESSVNIYLALYIGVCTWYCQIFSAIYPNWSKSPNLVESFFKTGNSFRDFIYSCERPCDVCHNKEICKKQEARLNSYLH